MTQPVLFEAFPDLKDKIPWLSLDLQVTPVKELTELGGYLNVDDLWVKCDNETNSMYGSNKPRKLEFILGEVLEQEKSTIVTMGALGSNHLLAIVLYCQKKFNGVQDIKPVLLCYHQPVTEDVRNKLLIFYSIGTKLLEGEMLYTKNLYLTGAHIYGLQPLKRPGKETYYLFAGGSNKTGTLGYVNAAFELKKQIEDRDIPKPDYIFITLGTAGTMAGLELGFKLAGLDIEVIGVRVVSKFAYISALFSPTRFVQNLVKRTYKYLRKKSDTIPKIRFEKHPRVLNEFFGGQYGQETSGARIAMDLFLEQEKVLLDKTYTSKTAAGMIDFINNNNVKDKCLLFWNTFAGKELSLFQDPSVKYTDLPGTFHKFFT